MPQACLKLLAEVSRKHLLGCHIDYLVMNPASPVALTLPIHKMEFAGIPVRLDELVDVNDAQVIMGSEIVATWSLT